MISAFVDTSRIPVWDDERENAIYIKPKMGYGDTTRLMDELTRMRLANGTQMDAQVMIGAYELALIKTNIVGWEGPIFGDESCTPENIERLDPSLPLVRKTAEEIGRRNPLDRLIGGSSKTAGAPSSKGTAKLHAANGTSTSVSRTATTGRRPK